MELNEALDHARTTTHGVLVTIKRDGRPQLSNILYAVDDDGTIRISVTAPRAKTKNLGRDGRASLYVGGEDFWTYLVIEGTAELSAVAKDPHDAAADELQALYQQLAGEHPDWEEYRKSLVTDQRLVARITPDRAYGMWS